MGALSLSCAGRQPSSSHAIVVSKSNALAIAQYVLGSCPALARQAHSTADGAALEYRIVQREPKVRDSGNLSPVFADADLRFTDADLRFTGVALRVADADLRFRTIR